MQQPVHVTVQMATVGLPVKVSALHEMQQVLCAQELPRNMNRVII